MPRSWPPVRRLARRAAPSDTNDNDYFTDLGGSSLGVVVPGFERDSAGRPIPPLPINKPPYGVLTAIDMSTGEHRWQVPIRDTPADPRLVVPRPLPESGDATDGQ